MTGVTGSPAAKEGGQAISMARCTCLTDRGQNDGEEMPKVSSKLGSHILQIADLNCNICHYFVLINYN